MSLALHSHKKRHNQPMALLKRQCHQKLRLEVVTAAIPAVILVIHAVISDKVSLLECELDAVVKQPVVTSVRQRFKQPAVILVIHAATSVKVSLHACEIVAVVKQLAVMIARLPLKRPAAILVIPAATNVWVSLLACELAVVVNQLATHAKRLQWPCLK
ncbi:MAG: hypothetical protein P8K79_06015 [Mariniblastus sp.]|nr:hypothetical protein [Mariniblastus sp.]